MIDIKQKECSAVVFDIRDFTNNLINFTEKNDPFFIKYVEYIQNIGIKLARKASPITPFYNSTGDGFLMIFFSTMHFANAFVLLRSSYPKS